MNRLSLLWTAVAAMLLAHHVYLWTGGLQVETNLLSLLPAGEGDVAAEEALAHLSESAARSVVVLITGATEAESQAAARQFLSSLPGERLSRIEENAAQGSVIDALGPFQDRLLSVAQLKRLREASDDALAQQAWALLSQPVGQRLSSFQQDPLQFFPEFLKERAQFTPVRPAGEWLMAGSSVLLRFEVKGAAFALDGVPHLAQAIDLAKSVLPAGVEVLAAGVPLFAEAAAVQANAEVNTVGWGSLAAILIIMWLAFRSPRPLVLVVLSVGMGVAAGLSACALLFGHVHLMTLVFGAGLVGVAEDYGIHYFCSRQAQPGLDKRELLRHLRPGLLMAMLTSVAGYAMLAIAPLPGLRQVAVFSAVGLGAAFLTVLAWFPWLDGGTVRATRFASVWAGSRAKWPSLSLSGVLLLLTTIAVLGAWGFSRLKTDDDVRALQASPRALIDAQRVIAERIGLPSPAQFFLVRGKDEAERLEREEQLTAQLDALRERGALRGYDAVSSWVPSPARQEQNQAAFVKARSAVLAALADELEESAPAPASSTVLTVPHLLSTGLGRVLNPLWMKDAQVVLLHAPSRERLSELAALSSLPGVRFVDRTADWSELMGRWRVGMSELMVLGYALIFAILSWRFRIRAWRALLPTAVASVLALVAVSALGEPLTLFHILALWLLLGMGVDYGIFLLEHPADDGEAWLAIGLGAVSTLLSFGLLAVSKTAAIHAFGVTLGVGVTAVWLLSPLFAQRRLS